MSINKYRFSIDRGGTFTDVYAKCPSGATRVCKLLSKNEMYGDAPTEGIRRIIEMETRTVLARDAPIDSDMIEWIRMGTTVATNALLERNGEPTALLITRGFRDLLHIGNQARPDIFDLVDQVPPPIYSAVVEVNERVILSKQDCELDTSGMRRVTTKTSREEVIVVEELDMTTVKSSLEDLLKKGIKSIAVVLLHSWVWDDHEVKVKELALEMGFRHVSCSSEVMRMIRAVPRGFTTVVDSYTTPLIHDYLHSFTRGFTHLSPNQVLFMQSDGGLTTMQRFCGCRAVLSGPAGGVVGYARVVYDKYKVPVIGFDMGGTSTDVSRFDGQLTHTFENVTAGVPLQCAQLDIQTVAAGGGSILTFTSGLYTVGPESAGSSPGPVAYDQGGSNLTITDANLVCNRLVPSRFPKIFGPSHDSPLNVHKTLERFQVLTNQINEFNKHHHHHQSSSLSVQDVALGFISVANETMARPIRNITQGKGFDPSNHMLACFGGAGGQHACAIAASLGIKRVSVPRYAGILSAVGIFLADVVVEACEPVGKGIGSNPHEVQSYVADRFKALGDELKSKLEEQSGTKLYDRITIERYLNIRYNGTDCALMVKNNDDDDTLSSYAGCFREEYSRQFGFTLDRDLVIDDLRVRVIGANNSEHSCPVGSDHKHPQYPTHELLQVWFEGGPVPTTVVHDCVMNMIYEGPCLIMDELSTIVVEPGWIATVTDTDVLLENTPTTSSVTPKRMRSEEPCDLDSIMLSIFSHRFMSIAEQMGRILQRTSVSTNIKERLDFSCAIFGDDGGLVSNAPHIPVHLGAMQEAVQYQLRIAGDCKCEECGGTHDNQCLKLHPGDVLLTNHPVAGGSHLPDLTVITPVFHPSNGAAVTTPIFFVANRGHHADIGGITPGSMPPNSKSIHEEGAVFKSFKLVRSGKFMEEELIAQLMKPGEYPGSSGSRNLSDNLSDLRAQVAANQKGINLLLSLVSEYSIPYVQTYMKYIQENAELAVRDMLKSVALFQQHDGGMLMLTASDFMDDGSELKLRVEIDREVGSATLDFSGTTYQVLGNCNAPKAVTLSAVIYSLRCLVGRDIPLNQGCLKPVNVIIPKGSILNPSEDAAVVGGNVLTSQRIVDVILKAFKACAASQGCMNNTTFGDDVFGYYETVAGGAGAGPTWEGRSGVHTHMTNTRITDPEILESRYPVILNHFSLSHGSGGEGKHRGGDGCRREILFRKPMKLSVLSERRVFSPYGMDGGGCGARGNNLLVKGYWKSSEFYSLYHHGGCGGGAPVHVRMGSKAAVDVVSGDMYVLISPGGGGWGD